MSYVLPPAGATDDEIERFLQSLRADARARVRDMIRRGAPEDEVIEYLQGVESAEVESPVETE